MAVPKNVYQDHADKIAGASKALSQYGISLAEVVFDLSFVVNFIVGKLLHVFSQEEEIYNYYNDKGNVFNQWFVKRGWGWTTAAIVLFYTCTIPGRPRHARAKLALVAFLRWAVATFWWVLFTQWCFGLPIMDKVFLLTGGKCALIPTHKVAAMPGLDGALSRQFYLAGAGYESVSVSSYSCRKLKGSWEGGHDPLGHVFLLVHASLYLFHEVREFWPGWAQFFTNANLFSSSGDASLSGRVRRFLARAPHAPVLLLLALWWFMLLVTNMYFHSLAEKLVGLVFGYLGVLAVYYAPRWARRTP
ncbi:hypothetical protein METBIDRAFT_42379 [Metschnikowia bicuspidata var. bicuspidata NRRL YB-4993]|uniref:Acyl-coenzyme A diphosphatase SCS3 n=1 Tax=Metschnikowia bicuspidata var. bicuspidata NRRL YB-4993 TaxID=869754 RepID=A0A1A0HC33_9ASCO|nr:hypothetical protein METBIDRAFT_42379 [Metschnikowia bicuspidata var. bicuspidata NRRL YB-4993]OBA21437.1 hypothetical protein METBIDRAFT_42379 [Metschnikowia bicuspidata var. bicuspidata NRRL YB-4993]